MTEINITALVRDYDPFEFSHSAAEGGKNAGPETWNAAKENGPQLLTSEEHFAAAREWLREFGAWSDKEIARYSDIELNAFAVQFASGEIREAESLVGEPMDSWKAKHWRAYRRLSEEGSIQGSLYGGVLLVRSARKGNPIFWEMS